MAKKDEGVSAQVTREEFDELKRRVEALDHAAGRPLHPREQPKTKAKS